MFTTEIIDREKIRIAQLVTAAQAGDREAFGELFHLFESQIFSIAMRRLGDFADAQELCQDVFIQAMEKLDQLRTAECFGAWIRSIAHRMAINRAVRRAPSFTAEAEFFEAAGSDEVTPLVNVLTRERQDQVRHGLARLGELDRKTLEAFYVDGHSLAEMVIAFRAPLGTIKRRLHVARKRLAKEVSEVMAV